MRGLALFTLIQLHIGLTQAYPIEVSGSRSAMQRLVELLNCETSISFPLVRAQKINSSDEKYGLSLTRAIENQSFYSREGRFLCALNYLLGDTTKVVQLRVVENDSHVLIGDARNATIDIADIEKFNINSDGEFTAFNVLLHELYEQYQLQVVAKLSSRKITEAQLRKAHQKAIQKESNFYSLTVLRTSAEISEEFIHIEFTSRIDASRRHYCAHFTNGNIDRIEINQEASQ